jgi:hypothetical protein
MLNRILLRAVTVSALAVPLAWPQPAMAEPFCDFLKRVLAAKGDGFARLRGPLKGKPEDKQYEGTLKPQPDASCTASPADVDGRPYYSCSFGKYPSLRQGEPLYYDLAAQTRRCFPAAKLNEEKTAPKAADPFPFEGRTLSGVIDGYDFNLDLSNKISALRWMAEQIAARMGKQELVKKQPISFDLSIDVRRSK